MRVRFQGVLSLSRGESEKYMDSVLEPASVDVWFEMFAAREGLTFVASTGCGVLNSICNEFKSWSLKDFGYGGGRGGGKVFGQER